MSYLRNVVIQGRQDDGTITDIPVSQPSFPFTMAAYSAGSTTNVSVACASYAGFIEGAIHLAGPRMTYSANSTSVSTSFRPLFTVRNDYVYGGRANQTVINVQSLTGAIEDTTPVTIALIKNGTLGGVPNYTQWATGSCTYVDTAATSVTTTDNSQLLYSASVGADGEFQVQFPLDTDHILLQPGETLTVAAKTVTGTASYVLAALNTREDQ